MQVAIVFAALVAVACAGVLVQDQDVSVLRYDNTNDGNNQYQWKWVHTQFIYLIHH